MRDSKRVTKLQEVVYELKIGDVMSRNPIAVHPKAPMSDLREILRSNRISGLPVVDKEKLVGIISIEDFIKFLADRQADCPIERKMTKDIETLYEDDLLASAIDKFETTGRGRYLVVDRKSGKLVGIVTKGDVIEGLLRKFEIDYHKEEIQQYRASHIFEDIEADDTTLVFEYYVEGENFKKAGEGSSRLKRTLKHLGIHPDIVRRIAIASYEAEMNLVIYTKGGKIGVRVQPEKIQVEVTDSGPGIPDVTKALEPGYSTAADWVRELGFGAGMGLPNIQRMGDECDIESRVGEGTRLRVTFYTGEGKHDAGESG